MARITRETLRCKILAINKMLGVNPGEVGSLHLLEKHGGKEIKYAVGILPKQCMGYVTFTGENNWLSATACMMFLDGYEKGFCRGSR